jgi:site-specific DNA-methyltransferase (adenine-specific)
MLSRMKFEFDPLVEEILDQLPMEVWTSSNTTFLDPAIGGGQFVRAIEQRLRAHGHSDENISRRVFGFESGLLNIPYAREVARAKYKRPLVGQYETKDFLKWESDMRFDVVVGNPPYQDSSNSSSFTNIWSEFVLKSAQLSNRYVCMVTPKTWGNQVTKENSSSKVFQLIKNHATVVNIDECGKYFPSIGSSFSYYVIDLSQLVTNCQVVAQTEKFTINWQQSPFLINSLTEIGYSIIKKLREHPMLPFVTSAGTVGDVIEQFDATHPYSVRYSAGTEKWSDTPHQYQFANKLIFANQTTKNCPIHAPASAPANRGVFYLVDSDAEANLILRYFDSKIIKFYISEQRMHHGVLNTQVLRNIPKVDLTRTWTDEELYAHFNLTQDEIDYIEATVVK